MEKKKISDYINIPKDLAPSPPESQILKLFDEKELISKSNF
ncbi:hypothetical protein [Succinivibrio dextrinosolvens]|nr:hypothetical protein [Succinivibrio dextrinosolvens]